LPLIASFTYAKSPEVTATIRTFKAAKRQVESRAAKPTNAGGAVTLECMLWNHCSNVSFPRYSVNVYKLRFKAAKRQAANENSFIDIIHQ
jgi:hypothetical protein